MNPLTYFRRRKAEKLEREIAGLAAKLKRTEELAKAVKTTVFDEHAADITQALWEKKTHLRQITEKITQ